MLGTASAGKYDNTWSVDIKDAAVKNIEGVNLEGEVETQVSDQLAAGATYEQNSAKFAPRTLFTRWTSKGGDPPRGDGDLQRPVAGRGDRRRVREVGHHHRGQLFDTAGDNLLTNVEASRDVTVKGRTVNVAPAYNFVSKVASLTSNLALSADTSVELKLDSTDVSNRDALKGTMSIDHSINANDSIKPTFDLDSGSATYEYTRKLDGDAELTVAANPGKSIEIEWDDAGSKGLWTTNVQMPWGKPVGASVSFKRKFSL
ncbi:hypothetical protein JL720_3935 [Aureococcus anophagefferens]|nr:hypothetical protein JL720_3935 [Aureococcus anophagefferens]